MMTSRPWVVWYICLRGDCVDGKRACWGRISQREVSTLRFSDSLAPSPCSLTGCQMRSLRHPLRSTSIARSLTLRAPADGGGATRTYVDESGSCVYEGGTCKGSVDNAYDLTSFGTKAMAGVWLVDRALQRNSRSQVSF